MRVAPGPTVPAHAGSIAQLRGGNGTVATIPRFTRADFAAAPQDVPYGTGAVRAVTAVAAVFGLRRGVRHDIAPEAAAPASAAGTPSFPGDEDFLP